MAKIWFETKDIKTGFKLAGKIWELKEFDDHSIMIETPKKIIAWCGGKEPVSQELLKKIDKERFK